MPEEVKGGDGGGKGEKAVKAKAAPAPISTGGRAALARVELLDATIMDVHVDRKAKGSDLLVRICEALNIVERDYFGLLYEEKGDPRCWLDLDKRISKFFRSEPWQLKFSVKFYPPEPSQLKEEITRYQLCLQIRRDLLSERLPCSFVTHALLGSYLVQSELGDYDSDTMGEGSNYLKEFRLAPDQTPELEDKVCELHKTHRGQSPAEAELNYLENAKKLAMYGVDFHPARDSLDVKIMLGVCSSGLHVHRDNLRMNRFAWPKILKISYKRHNFYIKIRPGVFEQYESTVGFKLPTHRHAKKLWKTCVEHHTFFRLTSPEPTNRSVLFPRLGSRFRYSGRTHYEAKREPIERPAPPFTRSLSARRLASASMDALAGKGLEDETAKRHTMSHPPSAPHHQTQPLVVTPQVTPRKEKVKARGDNGKAGSISSASSAEGVYEAGDTKKPPGGVQVLPSGGLFSSKKAKEKEKRPTDKDKENRADNEQPQAQVNGTESDANESALSTSAGETPKSGKKPKTGSFFFGSAKKEKSPKDKEEKEKEKEKEKKPAKQPKSKSKIALLDSSNEGSNLDTSGEKSPPLSHTKQYDYTEEDPTAGQRKPPTLGGFSYEKEPPSPEKSKSPIESPTARKAKGLAFNYAPGEEKKVAESAVKRRTNSDEPKQPLKTPGLDYVESAALKEQAKLPKSGDPSSALLDAERLAIVPPVLKKPGQEIQLLVITAKFDPKQKKFESSAGQVDVINGVIDSVTGKIDSDFGIIDPKTGAITYTDLISGKQETRNGHVDPKSGNIFISTGVVNPNTGSVDNSLAQLYVFAGKNDPTLKVVSVVGRLDPNTKQLSNANTHIENSKGLLHTDSGLIITKYGSLDPSNGKLTYVDPKSGKSETRQGHLDTKTGHILFNSNVINPKTGKVDSVLGQQFIIGGENDAVVKVITITGRIDPTTKNVNLPAGKVDTYLGVKQANGLIQTKMGLIDPKSGIIISTDPHTGKQDVLKAELDPKTSHIYVKSGLKSPETGKVDPELGQEIIIAGESDAFVKIITITARFDPRTRQVEQTNGTVEETPGILQPNGFVISKYGLIDPRSGQIHATDAKTGKQEVKQGLVDPKGHITLTSGVVDPSTGQKDQSLGQQIIIAGPEDTVIKLLSIVGRIDPKTKAIDQYNGKVEVVPAVVDKKTGLIHSKYGSIDPKAGSVTLVNPATGKPVSQTVQVDPKTGHITVTNVINPETGDIDPNYGQKLIIGGEDDVILKIVTITARLDPKTKTLDLTNGTTEIAPALQQANGRIVTKIGVFEPDTGHFITTDPKSGKQDSKKCHVDPSSGQITLTSGVVDPKTGKVDSSLNQLILIGSDERPVVDVTTSTGKLVQGSNKLDPTSAKIVKHPAILIPETNQIVTHNAVVDLSTGSVQSSDPKTGKPMSKQGTVDAVAKSVIVTGVVDPKSGKSDPSLSQIITVESAKASFVPTIVAESPKSPKSPTSPTSLTSPTGLGKPVLPPSLPLSPSPVKTTSQIPVRTPTSETPPSRTASPASGSITPVSTPTSIAMLPTDADEPPHRQIVKIMTILCRFDPKTKKPDLNNSSVEHSTGVLYPKTGLVETKYGVLDVKNGNVEVTDPMTGQTTPKRGHIEAKTGQVIITGGAIDPKTNKIDPNLGQIFSIAKQEDPVVEITAITGKIDPKTGLLSQDPSSKTIEHTKGKVDVASGQISTKYGVIDPTNGVIFVAGKQGGTKKIEIDDVTGHVAITGVEDPKSGKFDENLTQIISVGAQVDPIVEVTTYVGKLDSKRGIIDPKNSVVESTTGQFNPDTNKIDTKYGQIDLVKGTVTYNDPKSGKIEIKDTKIDPVTGQLLLKSGQVNPKSGKPDKDIGRIVSIRLVQNKFDPITGKPVVENDPKNVKVDPKTNQIWTASAKDPVTGETIYTSGQIDPKTGYVITIYGRLDPKTNQVVRSDANETLTRVDPKTGQIYTATGDVDDNKEPLYSASQIDPASGDIYTKVGRLDPLTGRLIIVKVFIITQKDEGGKIREIDPSHCTIDETTGKIVNVATKTVYVYQMVDPITGETIEVDPKDPRLIGARTTLTQTMTLSGKIDPATGRIRTEYGDIDPDTGDIDPATAVRDPVTGELVLHYSQIDPSHFTDKSCNYVIERETTDVPAVFDIQTVNSAKFSTFGKEQSPQSTVVTSSEHLQHGTPTVRGGSRIPVPAAATPTVVKTTTKQVVTRDKDGVTHNVEEEVENLNTGEVTFSTHTNKAETGGEEAVTSGGPATAPAPPGRITARAVTTRTATSLQDPSGGATQSLSESTVAHSLASSARGREHRTLTQHLTATSTTTTPAIEGGVSSPRRGSVDSASSGDSGTPIDFDDNAPIKEVQDVSIEGVPSDANIGTGTPSAGAEHVEGEIISSQTISSKTRTVETITYKTERDGVVETRVEQKITIQSDGDPIDHDRALAEAIQEATAMNPDMTVEKIEIQQQTSQQQQ